MTVPLSRLLLYRYGPIAWVWRALMIPALAAGAYCAVLATIQLEPILVVVAAPLALPALYLGRVVAVRIERLEDGDLLVRTLLFQRRRLARSDLGAPRLRQFAQGDVGQFYAPRAWIPVRDRLPIYLDLLAHIPDRSAFGNAFRIDKARLPSRDAR